MTCPMNTELASYALGSLSSADRSAVHRHLADCRDCRDELVDVAGVLALLRRTQPEQSSWEAGERDAGPVFRPAAERQPHHRRPARLLVGSVLLTVGAILAAAGHFIGKVHPPRITVVCCRRVSG
jgi:anti-sigma factor RsiW